MYTIHGKVNTVSFACSLVLHYTISRKGLQHSCLLMSYQFSMPGLGVECGVEWWWGKEGAKGKIYLANTLYQYVQSCFLP